MITTIIHNSQFIIHNYDYRVCYYCMIGWVVINMNYSFISESYHHYSLRTLSKGLHIASYCGNHNYDVLMRTSFE